MILSESMNTVQTAVLVVVVLNRCFFYVVACVFLAVLFGLVQMHMNLELCAYVLV
jgi:hypothetical protein